MAARYYVYELIDPRTWQTFYVGKGQRNRLWAHEREAMEGGTHQKCQVVRDIWESGHAVVKSIVQWFHNENDALSFEKAQIESHGIDTLTNMVPGIEGLARNTCGWNKASLNVASKQLANAIVFLSRGQRLLLAGQDITPAISDFVNSAVKRMGQEAVAAAVLPHGVEVRYANPQE